LVISGSAETVDQRHFSIDTFRLTPNEVRLAEKRVHAYWTRHQAEYAADARYLAVEAAEEIADSQIANSRGKTAYRPR